HDLPFLALGLVEAAEVGDETEVEADALAAAVADELAHPAVIVGEDAARPRLAHAVDDKAHCFLERARQRAVGGVSQVMAIAAELDVGLAEGAVQPEQHAEAGTLLADVQRGDERALGDLRHHGASELARQARQALEGEGPGRRRAVEELAELLAPARRHYPLGVGLEILADELHHAAGQIRLAVW